MTGTDGSVPTVRRAPAGKGLTLPKPLVPEASKVPEARAGDVKKAKMPAVNVPATARRLFNRCSAADV